MSVSCGEYVCLKNLCLKKVWGKKKETKMKCCLWSNHMQNCRIMDHDGHFSIKYAT
jgi:hypothetical protein